jgi:hypothetical protein
MIKNVYETQRRMKFRGKYLNKTGQAITRNEAKKHVSSE